MRISTARPYALQQRSKTYPDPRKLMANTTTKQIEIQAALFTLAGSIQ
jgi:hypothetical protein